MLKSADNLSFVPTWKSFKPSGSKDRFVPFQFYFPLLLGRLLILSLVLISFLFSGPWLSASPLSFGYPYTLLFQGLNLSQPFRLFSEVLQLLFNLVLSSLLLIDLREIRILLRLNRIDRLKESFISNFFNNLFRLWLSDRRFNFFLASLFLSLLT